MKIISALELSALFLRDQRLGILLQIANHTFYCGTHNGSYDFQHVQYMRRLPPRVYGSDYSKDIEPHISQIVDLERKHKESFSNVVQH